MTDEYVVSSLIKKRSELAGRIVALENELTTLRAALIHLDGTINLLDPSVNTSAIAPKKEKKANKWFKLNELPRYILDTLRKASEPLTSAALAKKLANSKLIDEVHLPAITTMVNNSLYRLKKKGYVVATDQELGNLGWSLISRTSMPIVVK